MNAFGLTPHGPTWRAGGIAASLHALVKPKSPMLAVLFAGCAAVTTTYSNDTDLEVVMVDGERDEDTRFVTVEKAPIPPTEYGEWLIPSEWAVALAESWADLPFAFDPNGPEYCVALGVDRDRMLHASAVVRYLDDTVAKHRCPRLIWRNGKFMIGLGGAHGHSTLSFHGERMSVDDAAQGSPVLASAAGKAKIEMARVAVHFFTGERLMGIDPSTGKEAPVPAQSLLFTRANGTVRVFLWIPLATEEEGKSNFVQVYKPAPNNQWKKVGVCWADVNEVRQDAAFYGVSPVRCDPGDFWLQ